jgi:hypothetical protein
VSAGAVTIAAEHQHHRPPKLEREDPVKRSITEHRQVAVAVDTIRRLCPPSSDLGLLLRAGTADHLDALAAIAALRARLCELEEASALNAIHRGVTIEQVSDALGISQERAWQRWGTIADSIAANGNIAPPSHPNT